MKIRNYMFAAADILRSTKHQKAGVLKDIFGHQLLAWNVPNEICNILNRFGVATSKETVHLDGLASSVEMITKGWDVSGKKYDLPNIGFDNVGFQCRKGTGRVGYDQYTA